MTHTENKIMHDTQMSIFSDAGINLGQRFVKLVLRFIIYKNPTAGGLETKEEIT